ncbi:hypothetical protein ACFFJN_07390 [Erwinia mallotivora]
MIKKIILASALAAASSHAMAANVLVVLSDSSELELHGGKVHQTGFTLMS